MREELRQLLRAYLYSQRNPGQTSICDKYRMEQELWQWCQWGPSLVKESSAPAEAAAGASASSMPA